MKRIVVAALVSAAALAGCVQTGNTFDVKKVAELTPGVSTKQDAIAKLGQPVAVSAMPGGGELVQWRYAYGTGIGVSGGASTSIMFTDRGIMAGVMGMTTSGAAPDLPQLPQNDPHRIRLGIGGEVSSQPAGIRVRQITPGSVADSAGIRVGDTITVYGGKQITSNADMASVTNSIKRGDNITITVVRDGDTLPLEAKF